MAGTYSFASYDLDLYDLDETEDPDKIVGVVSNLIQADSDFKIFPARQWIENFLFYGGVRDIHSRFGAGTVTGNSLLSNIFPGAGSNTPQTNRRRIAKTFKAVQVQAANATRQRPSIKIWPESDDERAIKKAKLANVLLDYLWDAEFEDDIYYESMLWALLTPLVGRKDSLDFSFNKSRMWPSMQPGMDPNTGQPTQIIKRKSVV